MSGGWASRLKLGLSRVLSLPNEPISHTAQGRSSNNINVNAVKYAMSPETGGFSQPVWGPEISTVGAYSREGYTSRTFDTPTTPFTEQVYYVRRDEDVQLSLNRLASQVTGGEHYWKSEYEGIQDQMQQFSTDIDFDWMDTIMIKELLAYGNTVWKPRLGIANVRNKDDLLHIPISSFVRIWWDRQRRPYKFEFRGSEYQGYHNSGDIIHMLWNPVNGSLFGTGFMTSLTATRDFEELTPSGSRQKRLPSLMDRKYSTSMTMHLSEKRYVPHNVYETVNASVGERSQLAADLADLETAEDIIVGNKVTVQELGSNTKAFNPEQFQDLTTGQIQKATGDFSGKQGSESSHQYANAETSKEEGEIGLAAFPLAVTRQLQDKLFQPWYDQNGGVYDPMYGGGMVALPWEEANPELNFGHVQKQDLETKDQIALIQLASQTGAVPDPIEMRKLLEDAGLGLTQQNTDQMSQTYNPQGAVYPPDFNTYGADQQPRPNQDPNYTSSQLYSSEPQQSMDASPSQTNQWNPQPSPPGLNFTSPKALPKGDIPDHLDIDDMNSLLAATGDTMSESIQEQERKLALAERQSKQALRETIVKQMKKIEDNES